MGKIYGYCRISTKHQEIGGQQVNILRAYPTALIFEETHSGGDYSGCIVFDSVSRFSRDNVTGPIEYKRLFKDNINLVFLNEPYINIDNYRKALDIAIPKTGMFVDPILAGWKRYLEIFHQLLE